MLGSRPPSWTAHHRSFLAELAPRPAATVPGRLAVLAELPGLALLGGLAAVGWLMGCSVT